MHTYSVSRGGSTPLRRCFCPPPTLVSPGLNQRVWQFILIHLPVGLLYIITVQRLHILNTATPHKGWVCPCHDRAWPWWPCMTVYGRENLHAHARSCHGIFCIPRGKPNGKCNPTAANWTCSLSPMGPNYDLVVSFFSITFSFSLYRPKSSSLTRTLGTKIDKFTLLKGTRSCHAQHWPTPAKYSPCIHT